MPTLANNYLTGEAEEKSMPVREWEKEKDERGEILK